MMGSIFLNRNTALSALTAIGLALGAMSFSSTAQATDSNPLLGDTAGAISLNSDQMKAVDGLGDRSDKAGERGIQYSKLAYNTGRYARYNARRESRDQYSSYYKASDYARFAARYYKDAGDYSKQKK
jgi:hypothetical protein